MDYQYIFFDLDGTLTDPKEGIINSIQYALKRYGVKKEDHELLHFIGPPLHESFSEVLNSKQKGSEATEVYREYFSKKGKFENLLYDGIDDFLKRLKENKKIICLATSKPTVFSEEILYYFKIHIYFDVIVGSNLDGTRVEKKDVIAEVIKQVPQFDPKKAVMIGDRKHDIIGARYHNVDTIAVTYGYGKIEELKKENPNYFANSVADLDILLK